MPVLKLVLGDQLNPLHPWFSKVDDSVTFVMMEVRQETDYVLHHAQKILGIFAAMRDFAHRLRNTGHQVHYITIDSPDASPSMTVTLDRLIAAGGFTRFEYQAPDEYRLDQILTHYCKNLTIESQCVDTAHFYTHRHEASTLFTGRKHWLMEYFYRQMRVKHQVLMESNGTPAGGHWNFDHENRQVWRGHPPEPRDIRIRHDHQALWDTIVQAGVSSFGDPHADAFSWPLNREEALIQLERFIAEVLPHFGTFQDAMSMHGRHLFHSLLSFALNTKMLNPREVVAAAEQAYREGRAPLPAVEGFIRQIIGWREYVRGVYWARMPDYVSMNAFAHSRALPEWFWTGKTHMNCLSHAIGQSLSDAYAHHIQRLMIIGNFALLAGLSPQALHEWYLGVYIDAFEWVEAPNTLGMSQFADGGQLATKPYVSTAAYIDRMSDYCKTCRYQQKQRTGPGACPFNALYWDFFIRHDNVLRGNPRLGPTFRTLDAMTSDVRDALRDQAAANLLRLDTL